jgi:hypothetical protein
MFNNYDDHSMSYLKVRSSNSDMEAITHEASVVLLAKSQQMVQYVIHIEECPTAITMPVG